MKLPRLAAMLCLILSVVLAGVVIHRMVPPSPRRVGFDFERGWDPASAKQQQAAQAVVGAQIDAFRRDDYARAVSYLSPLGGRGEAQKMRMTITHFFPEFAHPKHVTFGPVEVQRQGSRARVPVRVLGEDGFQAIALYYLYPTPKGYCIEGVEGGGRLMGGPGRPH